MACLIKCLLCKHKDLSLDSQHVQIHVQWHMSVTTVLGAKGHGYPLAATLAEPVALKFRREILRINHGLPHTPHKPTLSMSSL